MPKRLPFSDIIYFKNYFVQPKAERDLSANRKKRLTKHKSALENDVV